MNSLKIKTTSGIHREIDLIDYAVMQRNADRAFDSILETPDGTQTLYQRARRRSFTLPLDSVPVATVAALNDIWTARQEVYFEANIGENTKTYHPFESGVTPYYGGGIFARGSVATYLASDGMIHEALSGHPRFEPCKFGNGILLERAATNYFYPSHGASGSTIWTSQAGSPVVAWDATVASNVYGKAGTVRIEMTTTTPDVVKATISGLTASTAYSCFVWVRGVGSVALSVTSATGTTSSGTVVLSMAYQKIAVEGFVTTGTSVEMRLTAIAADTRLWVSAHQVEAGYTYTSYIPTATAAATRALDQWVAVAPGLNFSEGSIAFWLKFPRISTGNDGKRYLWYSDSNFYGSITYDGKIGFTIASGIGIEIAYATHGLTPGTIAHFAFVWKRDYCAIIVKGVERGTTASNTRVSGAPPAFQLYLSTGCPNTVIDDLRTDNQYVEWRTSESGLYWARYANDAGVALCRLTQGRKFRIKDGDFTPREANPGYMNGVLKLEESSSDASYTIGEK